jgi:hypothetical protein
MQVAKGVPLARWAELSGQAANAIKIKASIFN